MSLPLKRSLLLTAVCGGALGAYGVGRSLGHLNVPATRVARGLVSPLTTRSAGLLGAGYAPNQEPASNVPPADIFENVLDKVQHEFVEPTGGATHLSNGALAALFASLDDPKTRFLDADMRKTRQDALEGTYAGIGATLTVTKSKRGDVDYRNLTVVDVMSGSPAEKAGLRSGDRITEIDAHWIIVYSVAADLDRIRNDKTKDDAQKRDAFKPIADRFNKGLTLPKAMTQLLTGEGKAHEITVERDGSPTPLKLSLTTAITSVSPAEYRVLNNNVGYLRVRQFNARASQTFTDALSKASGLKGLIVDLRQNPGGVTAEAKTGVDGYASALKLLGRLTKGGNLASIERKPNVRTPLTVAPSDSPLAVPTIVLVDRGTSNLAEMVASALKTGANARLVGSHTFGDNVLQLFATFKNGTGVEMATAHLLTAQGADLSKGLEPDIKIVAAANDSDPALTQALAALKG